MTTFRSSTAPKIGAIAMAAMAVSAHAYNLGKITGGTPEASFTSTRDLYEVERCIVMLDLPAQPSVYRSPDRPNESLIHFGVTTPMAIKLLRSGSRLEVIIYNGSKYAKRVQGCAEA